MNDNRRRDEPPPGPPDGHVTLPSAFRGFRGPGGFTDSEQGGRDASAGRDGRDGWADPQAPYGRAADWLDEDVAELLLDGRPVRLGEEYGPQAAATAARLSGLLAAARRAPVTDPAGEEAALAAFRAARAAAPGAGAPGPAGQPEPAGEPEPSEPPQPHGLPTFLGAPRGRTAVRKGSATSRRPDRAAPGGARRPGPAGHARRGRMRSLRFSAAALVSALAVGGVAVAAGSAGLLHPGDRVGPGVPGGSRPPAVVSPDGGTAGRPSSTPRSSAPGSPSVLPGQGTAEPSREATHRPCHPNGHGHGPVGHSAACGRTDTADPTATPTPTGTATGPASSPEASASPSIAPTTASAPSAPEDQNPQQDKQSAAETGVSAPASTGTPDAGTEVGQAQVATAPQTPTASPAPTESVVPTPSSDGE